MKNFPTLNKVSSEQTNQNPNASDVLCKTTVGVPECFQFIFFGLIQGA